MVPTLIEELVAKATDSRVRVESRQFYYDTLAQIQKAVAKAMTSYEKEIAPKRKQLVEKKRA